MRKLLWSILGNFAVINLAYAFNLSFLAYSPTYYYTKSDWAIAERTAINVLNRTRDNFKVNWSNPQTGAHGYFVPSNTTFRNGIKCRKLKIYNEAHEVTGQSTYQFCFIGKEWRIVER